MNSFIRSIFGLVSSILFLSCHFEEPLPLDREAFIHVTAEDGYDADIWRVCQFSSLSGRFIRDDYVGSGYSSVQLRQLAIDIVVYNFGLEAETVSDEGAAGSLSATLVTSYEETFLLNVISEGYAGMPVGVKPDLLHAGYVTSALSDTVEAECRCLTRFAVIELDGITGTDNLSGARVYVTGQSGGVELVSGLPCGGEVALAADCGLDRSSGTLKCLLRTFGRCRDNAPVILYLMLTDISGQVVVLSRDITESFISHGISRTTVSHHVEPSETSGGGMLPIICDWDDIIEHVNI